MRTRLMLLSLVVSTCLFTCAVSAGRPELPRGTPVTDAAWPDEAKFTFAILGNRIGDLPESWRGFDRSVAEIERLNPDFVMAVGNQIEGEADDETGLEGLWAAFHEHVAPLSMPLFMVPGRDELGSAEKTRYWRKHLGRTYCDFVYEDCHFIVLSTDEEWESTPEDLWITQHGVRPNWGLGAEQVRWAVAALERGDDARHTFIFMDKPCWWADDDEWGAIEEAIGDRPHTLVGTNQFGHLLHSGEPGERHLQIGLTSRSGPGHPVKELGSFSHYTIVSVESGDVDFAIQEPGASWPVDIAESWFVDSLKALLGLPRSNLRISDGTAILEVTSNVRNPLPKPGRVVARPVPTADNWAAAPESVSVDLAPGESRTVSLTLTASIDNRQPEPRVAWEAFYAGHSVTSLPGGPLRVYTDEEMRPIREWSVVGPFPLGEVDSGALAGARREPPEGALPGMAVAHGPETGWEPDAEYVVGGGTYRWQSADADTNGRVHLDESLGTHESALAYAEAMIYSPDDRRVEVSLGADDYAVAFLNGEQLGPVSWYSVLSLDVKAGWNRFQVKTANLGGTWYLGALLIDTAGDMRVSRPAP